MVAHGLIDDVVDDWEQNRDEDGSSHREDDEPWRDTVAVDVCGARKIECVIMIMKLD